MKCKRSSATNANTSASSSSLKWDTSGMSVKDKKRLRRLVVSLKPRGELNLRKLRKLSLIQAVISGIILVLLIVAYVLTSGCCHFYRFNLLRIIRASQWGPLLGYSVTAWVTSTLAMEPLKRSKNFIGTVLGSQMSSVLVGSIFVVYGTITFVQSLKEMEGYYCPPTDPSYHFYILAERINSLVLLLVNAVAVVVAAIAAFKMRGKNALVIHFTKKRRSRV